VKWSAEALVALIELVGLRAGRGEDCYSAAEPGRQKERLYDCDSVIYP
jgi:hypothetical protein